MMYYDLSIPLQSLLVLAYFLTMCIGGWLTPSVMLRKRLGHRLLVPTGIAACAVALVLFTAEARARLKGLVLPPVCDTFCRQPLAVHVGSLLLIMGYFAYLFRENLKYRKNTVTRSSVKEGVDRMTSGLCFYAEGGRVILANRCMNDLSHRIVGSELQDAELFWKTLSGGEVLEGVERLSFGSYPNFRLPDGSVWTFAREKLDGFTQLTAADTTLRQSLTDELREKNLDLAAMNLRLRRYGANVDELARARERLETKVRIHGELGRALLATRRYLADDGAGELPMDIWRRNIAMLRKEMESNRVGDPLQILRKAARSAGITLNIEGELYDEAEYRQFFLTAASEAMTNAVFHANAKTLCIRLTETADAWQMRFTNDGARPEKPIVEGGGLGSLRRKAEYIGAAMKVESLPELVLIFEGRKR